MSTVYVGARTPVLSSVQDVSLREMVFQLEKRVTLLETERGELVAYWLFPGLKRLDYV